METRLIISDKAFTFNELLNAFVKQLGDGVIDIKFAVTNSDLHDEFVYFALVMFKP